jgi:endonuclease-8
VPEGDTIHRVATNLRAALLCRRVTRFDVRGRGAARVTRPPADATVDAVEARGKHLLITMGTTVLHTHLGMHGSWHLYRGGERWRRPGTQARVIIAVDDGTTAVCFGAPTVETARAGAPVRRVDDLGPDLCAPDADLDAALSRLAAVDPHTEIGVALLDQRVAAGIGNVYKSEICFVCRVDPNATVASLDEPARRALFETAARLLRANLTTSRRQTYAGRLAVYGRNGRPCPRCGTPIRSCRQGEQARTTYWCPSCQTGERRDHATRTAPVTSTAAAATNDHTAPAAPADSTTVPATSAGNPTRTPRRA